MIADSSKYKSANLIIYLNSLLFLIFLLAIFVVFFVSAETLIFSIVMLSTGALVATFFSSSKVTALLAIKEF